MIMMAVWLLWMIVMVLACLCCVFVSVFDVFMCVNIRFNFHILFEFHILSDLAVILWMGWIHMVSQEQIVWMRSEMDGSSENEWCADDNPFGGVFHMMTVHVFLV
eukprot:847398_1